jgi:hypothetical protein
MRTLAVPSRRGPANGENERVGRTSDPGGWAWHRRGRVLVAVAALVLGIGSCQLPQPHLPKLVAGAAGGSTSTAVYRVPMQARSGPG